jgi:hypothetical protein
MNAIKRILEAQSKYYMRKVNESDLEDIKAILKENEYLSMLWSAELLPNDKLDELVRRVYINGEDNYILVGKDDKIAGCFNILHSDKEGELSVRTKENMDIPDIMELFGETLNEIAPTEHKNLTIQYCFD